MILYKLHKSKIFSKNDINYLISTIEYNNKYENIIFPHRHCERIIVKNTHIYNFIFNKIKLYIPQKINGMEFKYMNDEIKLIKYKIGDYFKPHKDGMIILNNAVSMYSLLIYLNDDYEGGEIKILKKKLKPNTGNVLILNQNVKHECLNIIRGNKIIIRIDLFYK